MDGPVIGKWCQIAPKKPCQITDQLILNRLERVGETLRAALNDLAVIAPEWLQALAPPEWYPRSGRRVENDHLPKTDAAREELPRAIAADGQRLLAAVDAAT